MADYFDDNSTVNPISNDRQKSDAPSVPHWHMSARRLLIGMMVLIVAAIILTLTLHIVSPEQAMQPKTSSGSQATPAPKVVYQADWTQGADTWTFPSHWSLHNGNVKNDGYGTEPLEVPFEVTSPNYSIQADLQMLSVPNYRACHSYGIEGSDGTGQQQFIAQISCIRQGIANAGFSELFVDHADSTRDSLATEDYTVSHNMLTFVVQVQQKNVGFCPGPSCLANVNSTTALWPMHIAILDVGVQLALTRLVISET